VVRRSERKQAGMNSKERVSHPCLVCPQPVLCHGEMERRVDSTVGCRAGLCKKDYVVCQGW